MNFQNELVKNELLIEELEVSKQILTIKVRDANNELQKARKTFINVSCCF